jgi:hypothetical protein
VLDLPPGYYRQKKNYFPFPRCLWFSFKADA